MTLLMYGTLPAQSSEVQLGNFQTSELNKTQLSSVSTLVLNGEVVSLHFLVVHKQAKMCSS